MGINVSGVEVGYDNEVIIQNIDFTLNKGEITTIIGPNGSGKSTILKAMTRLVKYQKGNIYLDGKGILEYGNKQFARKIGVLPQCHIAPPDFKVKDLVSYGRLPYQGILKKQSDEDEKIIEWAMKATGVFHFREKSIQDCSGGEAQRVWIATVLAQQPEVMFLDEPTTYLDISHQLEMMKLLKKLNRTSNIGIVMVLHDINQALEVSDRIIIIKKGEKYADGSPQEVITSKMMKEVYEVDCEVVWLDGRKSPILVYKEIE